MNPSSVVVSSVVIITSTTLVRRMREGSWESHVYEIVVFGFLLLISLLVLAIPLPSVAVVFAYLGMVGAFLINGPAVFSLLGSFGRGKGVV